VFGGDVAQAKDKQSKSDMKYRHVIIGAGVAARSCLKTLSAHDKTDLPGGYDGKVCARYEHVTDVPGLKWHCSIGDIALFWRGRLLNFCCIWR
jgi:hypothetical protein